MFLRMGLEIALAVQLIGHGAELVIPDLAETADERSLQKPIDGQMKTAAQLATATADVPLMVVQGYGAVRKYLLADGIEGTTDGLDPLPLDH